MQWRRLDTADFEAFLESPVEVQASLGVRAGCQAKTKRGPSGSALKTLVLNAHFRTSRGPLTQNAIAKETAKRRQRNDAQQCPADALYNPHAALERHIFLHRILTAGEFIHRWRSLAVGKRSAEGEVPLRRTVTCQ